MLKAPGVSAGVCIFDISKINENNQRLINTLQHAAINNNKVLNQDRIKNQELFLI